MSHRFHVSPNEPMSASRWMVIGLAVLMMAMDGFDVLSISFAATGIAAEWGIGFATLGWILSIELFGMALGALLNGWLADRFGRRPVLLGCLALTGIGMLVAGQAPSLSVLIAGRIVTGLGIGGILVCTNSMAAEFSTHAVRTLCIALVGAGYPLGAALGGFAASALLEQGGWRYVFMLGALFTVLILPFAYLFVPESPSWLSMRNSVKRDTASDGRMTGRWTRHLIVAACLVTAIYLFHVFSFYFLLKWTPRILTAGGYGAGDAARVLAWVNIGGVLGGVSLGILAGQTRTRSVTIALLLASSAAIVAFGLSTDHPEILVAICIFAGFACNGSILGIYAAIASAFPVELRAMGTGIAIGIGRLGAVLAPIVAGYLLETGLKVSPVAALMAAGSVFSALTLYLYGRVAREPDTD